MPAPEQAGIENETKGEFAPREFARNPRRNIGGGSFARAIAQNFPFENLRRLILRFSDTNIAKPIGHISAKNNNVKGASLLASVVLWDCLYSHPDSSPHCFTGFVERPTAKVFFRHPLSGWLIHCYSPASI